MINNNHVYSEKIHSNRTEIMFVGLAILFFALFIWRASIASCDGWMILFFCLSMIFLFYLFNYRTLNIQLTPEKLILKFGIFKWTVPLNNIADCRLDDIYRAMYYGGAGIHFMLIKGRYRISLNFLEYPRVAIALKVKQGFVRDVSFSTQKPDELMRLIKSRIS